MDSRFLFVVLLVFVIVAFVSVVPAFAEVTIQGTVEYYDYLRGTYKPAKNTLVEIEGDWLAFDVRVHTNNSGFFKGTQRDPWIGNFDINIDAYAQTAGMISIYDTMFSWWAYNVASQTVHDINGGQTCTINLKIGGPQNNAAGTWYGNIKENAHAFLLHQEIYDHYQSLMAKGFPLIAFLDTDVIAPAAGMTAYYNHFTDFINMTYNTLTGATGFNTGFGDWSNLQTGNCSCITYPYVLDGIRHESSHRINRRMAAGVPLGLNIPANHGPEMGSNTFLAYTEGFASFLPLVTLNMAGKYEPTPSEFSTGSLSIPAAVSPDDNNEWEGEVTAALWDLCDPSGTKEPMRYPAAKSIDGKDVPRSVKEAQKWTDRLADPNATRVRDTISRRVNVVFPVQTIMEFIDEYAKAYSTDKHALKTITYNRCLTTGGIMERPPYLDGGIGIGRLDNSSVGVKLNLVELDAEDRNFVTVYYWRQNGATVSELIQPVVYNSGWTDTKRTVTLNLPVSASSGTDDRLWFIVSDEMRSNAYCVPTPAALAGSDNGSDSSSDSGSSSSGGHRDPWDRLFIPINKPAVPGGDITRLGQKINIASQAAQPISAEQMQKAEAFQTAIRAARSEMQAYADAQELSQRMERALQGLARNADGVKLAAAMQTKTRATAAATTTDAAFTQWLTQIAGGKSLQRPLSAEAKTALTTELQKLNTALQQRQSAAGRAQQLSTQLQSTFAALSFGQESSVLQAGTKSAVEGMQKALTTMSTDQALTASLQTQAAAVKTLSTR